jgi:HK97 family phage major capsid protein
MSKVLTEEEFQGKVIERIDKTDKSIEGMIAKYDNLEKSTKEAMESFTNAKNDFSDKKDIQDISLKFAQLQRQLRLEQRSAYGSPTKALAADPVFRARIRTILIGALKLQDQVDKDFQKKDLDTANTPGSTYIDNAEIEKEIYDVLLTYGAYRTLDVRTVSTKSIELRLKTARLVAAFVDEAVAIGADATKAGSKTTVTPKKLGALISASSELLEDDTTGVVEDLLDDMVEAFASKLDWIAFTADGTADATDGGFTGMFFGGTAATAAATRTTIAATKYEDWLKCLTTVDPVVLMRMARWWIHPTLLAHAIAVKDDNGRPIFQTAIEAPSFGAIGTLFGYPVTPVGNAPSTNAASAKVACFGDPKAQAVRIRRDLTFARSEDWAFDTDEITFRGTLRAASVTRKATAIAVFTLPGA